MFRALLSLKNQTVFYVPRFNKKKALKAAKVVLPVAAVAAFFPDAAMATTTATDLMKSGDATVKGTFGKQSSVVNGWFWQKLSPAASCT